MRKQGPCHQVRRAREAGPWEVLETSFGANGNSKKSFQLEYEISKFTFFFLKNPSSACGKCNGVGGPRTKTKRHHRTHPSARGQRCGRGRWPWRGAEVDGWETRSLGRGKSQGLVTPGCVAVDHLPSDHSAQENKTK